MNFWQVPLAKLIIFTPATFNFITKEVGTMLKALLTRLESLDLRGKDRRGAVWGKWAPNSTHAMSRPLAWICHTNSMTFMDDIFLAAGISSHRELIGDKYAVSKEKYRLRTVPYTYMANAKTYAATNIYHQCHQKWMLLNPLEVEIGFIIYIKPYIWALWLIFFDAMTGALGLTRTQCALLHACCLPLVMSLDANSFELQIFLLPCSPKSKKHEKGTPPNFLFALSLGGGFL